MHFITTLMVSMAFSVVTNALPTAEPEALPSSDFSLDAVDIPIYDIEERYTENGTSIDALACHITAFGGDHCGGNIGSALSIPTNSQGVCVGTGPSAGHRRHSYKIAPACNQIRIYFYIANGCDGNTPHHVTVGSGCHNINTGGPVNSIKAIRA